MGFFLVTMGQEALELFSSCEIEECEWGQLMAWGRVKMFTLSSKSMLKKHTTHCKFTGTRILKKLPHERSDSYYGFVSRRG